VSSAAQGSVAKERSSVALGWWVIRRWRALVGRVDFLGAALIGVVRLVRRRGARTSVGLALQEAGIGSLPVIALIALAAGAVLTLLAMQQLEKVGLPAIGPRIVGIVILREIGPLITGIALAGRVAGSFAAEVAAQRGLGGPAGVAMAGQETIDSLVAPRVLALALAGPLLVAYADMLELAGSWLVARHVLGLPGGAHIEAVFSGLSLKHAIAAVVKGAAFGAAVALSGCYHGLRCTGVAGLGRAVRDAVVSAVVAVGVLETALIFVFKWVRL
jgi:phospholipid/cholesterol/gamma-HCH transport system permease protein